MWVTGFIIIYCSFMSLGICRVEAWSGHVCTKYGVIYFTEQFCARYDRWTGAYGCKDWKTRQSSKIGSEQHCCDGWKHNGNEICNIPTDVTSDPVNSSIITGSRHANDNRRKISADTSIMKRQVSTCGGYRTAQTETTTLTSPNFPSPYENNLRCHWTIEAPVNYVIVFEITYLDLEENNACSFDYISINLGGNHNLETNRICSNKTNVLSFITRSNDASIAFVTDGSVTKRGFSVQYKAVLNCGKQLTAKASTATLTSPLYPSQYDNNLTCHWTIEGPVNSTIILQITYIDLEETIDCSSDYIQIYLGQHYILETHRICRNNMKDMNYLSRYNEADVIFVTDSSVVKTGFSLQYHAATNCGGRLQANSTSAVLYSPSYPHLYGNNLYCHWTIEASAGSRIVIEIVDIDLEENTACSYDYLQIYLGERNILETGRICSYNSRNLRFITRSEKADVIFVTDSSIQKTGFQLSYKTVPRCGEYLTVETVPSYLTSPQYPSEYENNLFCLWTIKAPIHSRITLNIIYIDIEGSGDYCSYDYLQIYLGNHYIVMTKRICGTNTTGLIFVSGSNEADVLFVTDGSVTKRGFRVQYNAVSSCGGHLKAGTDTATLVSPNYPSQYNTNLRCHWTIEAPINYRIAINVTDIDLQESSDCLYDYLQIHLGNNYFLETNRICRKNKAFLNSISMSDEVHIIFITKGWLAKRGFSLQYHTVSPYTHVQTSPYKVIENQPLNVTCLLNSNQPAGHISWFPSGEGSVPSILYFSSVAKNNKGTYTCTTKITMVPTIEGQQTGINASQIDLDVLHAPSIQMMTSPYKVKEYQPLNVTCQANSNPPPDQISWSPSGESSVTSRLYFSSLSRNQSGTYRCTAQNTMTPTSGEQQIGISTSQIQVDVLYPPSIAEMSSPFQVIEYQSLNVICHVDSNPLPDQISWFPLGESSVPSRLYFRSVSRNNSGTYTCTAQNTMVPTDGGQQISRYTQQIQVDILYTAKITEFMARDNIYEIMENSTLELYCRVDSNPYSNISLSLGDYFKSATGDSRELIYRVTAGCLDAGRYTCSATNSVMDEVKVSAEINVKVLCHPRYDYQNHISSDYYVALNDNVTLVVNVIAYPEPTDIMWHHRAAESDEWQQVLNKIFSSTGLRSNITVHLGSQNDFGDYLVNMSNSFGTYEHIFHVIPEQVTQGPPAFPVGAVAGGVVSGVAVAVFCVILIIIFVRRRNQVKEVKDRPLELKGSTNETTSHGAEYEELHVNMTTETPYQELTVMSSNRGDTVRNAGNGSYDDMHLYSNAGLVSDTSMNQILKGRNIIYENTWIPR